MRVAFSESERAHIDANVGALCIRCSPAHVADQLRCVYDTDAHSVVVYEERPPWDDESGPWTRFAVARFRYYRSRDEWVLYWMPSDLQWHAYEPADDVHDLAALVAVVDADVYDCFFG